MTPSVAVEFVAWSVLGIFSILTVAAGLDIASRRHKAARRLEEAGLVMSRALSALRSGSSASADLINQLQPMLDHPVLSFAYWLLRHGGRVHTATAALKITDLITAVDAGRSNLLQAISRLAPLAALGGTVAGVAASFGAFSGEASGHAALYSGLALALNTTFVGVVVAIISYSLGAVHERWLERLESDLNLLLMEAIAGAPLRDAEAPDGDVVRGSDSQSSVASHRFDFAGKPVGSEVA